MRLFGMNARKDEGSLLAELMVASSITLGILALLGTLVLSAFKTDTYADQDNRTLAALRQTNDRIVKELRQARKVYIESFECGNLNRAIRFWIDADSDDQQQLAERITWRIEPTDEGKAQLTRRTDATEAVVYAGDLLWDETRKYFQYNVATPTCPPSTLPQPTTVTVSLVADVDPQRSAVARQIHSEVKLRNVPD